MKLKQVLTTVAFFLLMLLTVVSFMGLTYSMYDISEDTRWDIVLVSLFLFAFFISVTTALYVRLMK